MSSSREASKALEASRLAAEAADRERTRLLRAALRKHHSQRTADDDAALAADPEETARMKAAMEKAAARKASEAEVEEDDSTVYAKVQRLAHLLRSASHAVVYTGAGISTAADIPDYRGPQGVWTLQKKGGKRKMSNSSASRAGVDPEDGFVKKRPTEAHMALLGLGEKNPQQPPFPHMWRPHFSHMSEIEFFFE